MVVVVVLDTHLSFECGFFVVRVSMYVCSLHLCGAFLVALLERILSSRERGEEEDEDLECFL